jgi:single-strand DNA-binding protein
MYQLLILIGRVGQKKAGTTKNGTNVISYSVATQKSILNKDTQVWDEFTEWHNCVSFGKAAEHINEKVEVGDLIKIQGELRTRKWQDQRGTDQYTTEIVVNDFPMKMPRYWSKDGGMQKNTAQASKPKQQAQQNKAATTPQVRQVPDGSFDDFDDDFPDM